MVSDEGMHHLSLSIQFSFHFLQRCWYRNYTWSSLQSLRVCEHSCLGDEISSSMCAFVCVCACTYSFFLPSPSFFFGFRSPPCVRLLQTVIIIGLLAHSALSSFLVWIEEDRSDGRVQLDILWVKAEGHCVHKSTTSRVNSAKLLCLHALHSLLPCNITVWRFSAAVHLFYTQMCFSLF